jgi:hypothetical protein
MYNQQLLPKSFYHPQIFFDIDNMCGPLRIFKNKNLSNGLLKKQ